MIRNAFDDNQVDLYDNSLVIIDEIHNIRVSEEQSNKRIADTLVKFVKKSRNVQLLLLSATPMFNDYREIIWLLNLMNLNDNRPIVSIKDVFDSNGNFAIDTESGEEVGLKMLVKKLSGYVSFVQGEDPVNFPFRIFPTDFDKDKSILSIDYPKTQFNNKPILNPLKHIDLYTLKLDNYQQAVYDYILTNINLSKIDNNMDSLGYQIFQLPLNILNVCYPSQLFDQIQDDPSINFNKSNVMECVGKNGLSNIFDNIKSLPFVYKSDTIKNYGKVFAPDNIQLYSEKIYSICNNITSSEGISLIYSEKIYSGVLPMALALEELGFSRHNGDNLLSNKKKKLKYVMITGNALYSPNNKLDIEDCVHSNNVNGDKIKVIIISRAGSEGIDLKYIRNIHVMEPWYNMNRIEQVIGRGIRNKSHMLLPLQKRNCSVYLYGTILENNIESIDLYVYRMAEEKSVKIGKISRILKETSIDCVLNTYENKRYFKNDVREVPQILSTGQQVSFNIERKAFSSSCDYLETCSHKCMMYDDKYKKINIHEEEDNINYNKYHLTLNVNDVITKIKDLFSEKYFYTKFDIINRICTNKTYSIDIINHALNELLTNNLMVIFDRYNRKGKLVNINELYLFQPSEINNKYITLEERSNPIHYKNENLLIRVNNDDNKSSELPNISILNEYFNSVIQLKNEMKYIFDGSFFNDVKAIEEEKKEEKQKKERKKREKKPSQKVTKIIRRNNDDNQAYIDINNDSKQANIDNLDELSNDSLNEGLTGGSLGYDLSDEYVNISTEMIFDKLSVDNKLVIINLLNSSSNMEQDEKHSDIIIAFDEFVKKNIITNSFDMKIFVLGYTNKLKVLFYENDKWIEGSDAVIKLFTSDMKTRMESFKTQKNFNDIYGLNVFNRKEIIFKIKDNTNKEIHNIGARCSQLKKSTFKDLYNSIFSDPDSVNALLNHSKYKISALCDIVEFILRYLNKSNDKIWFLNSIETGLIRYLNIFKVNKL
jgi:hypothetical protein